MTRIVRVLAAAAVLVFCLKTFSTNQADVDLWGNVGFVTALPSSPDFHWTNTFSFTEPDHPWVNHEWLSQYLLHRTHDHLGNRGLLLVKTLLGLFLILLMSQSMRRDGVSRPTRFFFLLLLISTIGYGFSIRPHLFTYLLYAGMLYLLRHHGRRAALLLLILPLLGLLWTNLHGAFFIGIVLLALFIVLEAIAARARPESHGSRRQLLILTAALVLFIGVTFLNPYGWRLWTFIAQSAAKPRPYLSEWAPFSPIADLATHPDFVALAIISGLALVFSRKAKDVTWISILLVSLLAAFWLRRNIPLFAITAAFVVPAYADALAGKPLERMGGKVPAVAGAVILAIFIAASSWSALHSGKTAPLRVEVPQDRFPSEIIDFMHRERISGNALVFFDWAEYSIWKLYPTCRIFLDGRFNDAYSDTVIDDYFNFLYLGPQWENALVNYPVSIVLIHTGNPVFGEMMKKGDWQMVCTNKIAGLFLKTSEHRAFLDRVQSGEIALSSPEKEVFFP